MLKKIDVAIYSFEYFQKKRDVSSKKALHDRYYRLPNTTIMQLFKKIYIHYGTLSRWPASNRFLNVLGLENVLPSVGDSRAMCATVRE